MTEGIYRLPVIETVKTSWAKVKGTKGTIWAVIGIFFLIQLILGVLAAITSLQNVFNFIGWLIQIIAGACMLYVGIRRAQDAPIQYKMIKDVLNTPTILKIIGFYILQIVAFLPVIIIACIGVYLASAVDASNTMKISGALCYIVAAILSIFIAIRLWLGYGAVVDRKLNPWEAIKLTFKATKGNVWNLLGLFIINVFIMLVCVITLGIGLIWGIPWLMIIYGETYKKLTSRQDIFVTG